MKLVSQAQSADHAVSFVTGHGFGPPAEPPVQDESEPDDRVGEPHQSVIETETRSVRLTTG